MDCKSKNVENKPHHLNYVSQQNDTTWHGTFLKSLFSTHTNAIPACEFANNGRLGKQKKTHKHNTRGWQCSLPKRENPHGDLSCLLDFKAY